MSIFSKKTEQNKNEKSYEEAKAKEDKENLRRKGESNQAYNERVPIAFQPLAQPKPVDYLGRPIE